MLRLTIISALTIITVITLYTVKIFLFVGINFRGFYKMHWSLGFLIRGFKHYMQQSMEKMYFVHSESYRTSIFTVYKVTTVMKVKADIIVSITVSLIELTLIFVIMYDDLQI
jgi:predicted ABC-type exoprotein transport system permease subunit